MDERQSREGGSRVPWLWSTPVIKKEGGGGGGGQKSEVPRKWSCVSSILRGSSQATAHYVTPGRAGCELGWTGDWLSSH